MKIVLVNVIEFEPIHKVLKGLSTQKSTKYPPNGLLTLAAVLEGQGYEVEVVDFGNLVINGEIEFDGSFSENAAEYLTNRSGDVIGFSSRCDNYLFSLKVAQHVRRIAPHIPIIFGGPQATITDVDTVQNFPFIDYVVRHEAEFSLPALLEALGGYKGLDGIPGIVFRRGKDVLKNDDPPLILDLDQIPMPAYHHFPIETLDVMSVEVGRGCPFGCTFCVTNRYFNRRYRLKSADRIVDEAIYLRDNYGFQSFDFIHDMLTASRRLVMELCERITSRGLNIKWDCSARTDCVDRELLETMHKAGCRSMYFGIETGSQRMQKVVNKNLKLDGVHPVMELCSEFNIRTTASFITGFPEEKPDDIEKTLRMILELSPKASTIQLHLYSPTPGTPLQEAYRERITYNGYVGDQVFATPLSEEDHRTIMSYPDIFSNYFQVKPLYIPFEQIQGLDVFGYFLRAFKYFFFYLLSQPGAPTLYQIWLGLKQWLDEEQIKWDIESLQEPGLIDVLERYLHLVIGALPFSLSELTDAFNLDRALIRLSRMITNLPGSSLAEINSLTIPASGQLRDSDIFRLHTPALLMEARCNLTKIKESLTERKCRMMTPSKTPRTMCIAPFKIRKSSRDWTIAIIELNDVAEAMLSICAEQPIALRDLLPRVVARVSEQGAENRHRIEQLALIAIKRLIGSQVLQRESADARTDAEEKEVDDRKIPLIRLDALKPAPQPRVNIFQMSEQASAWPEDADTGDLKLYNLTPAVDQAAPQKLWR